MASIFDSLTNLVAQLATGKSKSAADEFITVERSPKELAALYRSDWIGRKLIDAPVFDMLREWRRWQAEPRLIEAIEDAEDRHKIRDKVALAARMGRLFGGAAIIVGADVSRPEAPLTPKTIGKGGIKYLTVVSRYDLETPDIDRDPRSPNFGLPTHYELRTNGEGSVKLHPSRVIRFLGADRLESPLQAVDCWSDSTLLAMYDAIHNAALSQTGIAELIHEAKVDVISIPDLGSQLSTDAQTSLIAKRFANANAIKSINNMLLLDEKEKWERKQTSFAGLPEVIDRYLQIVAAASDIPATRLLGTTAKGLNNSGDGDLRNYYDMLAGHRRQSIEPQLAYLDQLLWVDAAGSPPREVYFDWAPMWQSSEKEKADIAKTRADTTKVYAELGLLPEEALRLGVQNQLIEGGVYPGLEAAIATLQSSLNDPVEDPEAENDNTAADWAVGHGRNIAPRLAHATRS